MVDEVDEKVDVFVALAPQTCQAYFAKNRQHFDFSMNERV